MGLLSFLNRGREEKPATEINGTPVKVIEVGSAGTEIYGGYISEEYLAELRGRTWADKVDKMRRSDTQITMVLKALKLPLKSSNWYVNTLDSSEEAKLQKRLIEKALFEDTGKSFTRTLGEILTMLDFGYSLFELTFKPKLYDKELGPYNTLKSIAFRSQRTIERWNVNRDGSLLSVTQQADGDTGRSVDLDAKFLLHFAPEQEGDNYEGVSVLRPMYGNWMRKNHFLKLLAAGIEKYAIPLPTLEVPEGKENSEEYRNALNALRAYSSNQKNYITFPAGWKMDIKTTTFDAEKLRKAINEENIEMVCAILAFFLMLGANGGGGSYALGSTLSDFFRQTLTYLADHVSEVMAERVFKALIKMNLGDRPLLVELRCDGLNEQADKAWADMMKTLVDGKIVTLDGKLEEFVREKYKLPKMDPAFRAMPDDQAAAGGEVIQLSESSGDLQGKDKPVKKQLEVVGDIEKAANNLRGAFKTYLTIMGTEYINGVMKEKRGSSEASLLKAPSKVDLSVPSDYLETVRFFMTMAAAKSVDQVAKLFSRRKTLSEFRLSVGSTEKIKARIAKAEKAFLALQQAANSFERNPTDVDVRTELGQARERVEEAMRAARLDIEETGLDFKAQQKILARANNLLDTQAGDIKKAVALQFNSSAPSTDSDSILRKDLADKLFSTVSGPITSVGPDIAAGELINESRLDFSLEQDGVESFTAVRGSAGDSCDACIELEGTTLAANDPDLKRLQFPLHHNCGCYWAINVEGMKDNPPIDRGFALSKEAQASITLSEKKCRC